MTKQEMFDLAKEKANVLFNDGTQIRLTAEPKSYTIFLKDGKYYIGQLESESEKFETLLFKNRPVKEFVSLEGKLIARVQFLMNA
jgi:tRNA G10  N-methylase Trm11